MANTEKFLNSSGLSSLWAKIKSKFYTKTEVNALIPEPEVFVVNITINYENETYTADKTVEEIQSAMNAGKVVYGIGSDNTTWQWDGSQFISFVVDEDLYEYCLFYDEDDYVLNLLVYLFISKNNVDSRLNYYLSKNNTISYTPNGNYNPATKKYVDDSIPSASTTTPLMDGTASYGSGTDYARANHVHPTDTSRAAASDVLTKINTTSFTPTGDYNPATKKYVDDSVSSKLDKSITNSSNTALFSNSASRTYVEAYMKADGNGTAQVKVSADDTDGSIVSISASKVNISNVVTPTTNGMAANKKYVDDAISGFSTTLTGLTDTTISSPTAGQVLKYDSATSKWINSSISTSVTYTLSMSNNVITLTGSDSSTSTITLPVYNGGVSS